MKVAASVCFDWRGMRLRVNIVLFAAKWFPRSGVGQR